MSDVESRIKDVVVRTLKIDIGRIKDESRFVEDLGAESIQSVELVAAFEEEFDIEMDVEKAQEVQTISGAVEFIASYL